MTKTSLNYPLRGDRYVSKLSPPFMGLRDPLHIYLLTSTKELVRTLEEVEEPRAKICSGEERNLFMSVPLTKEPVSLFKTSTAHHFGSRKLERLYFASKAISGRLHS